MKNMKLLGLAGLLALFGVLPSAAEANVVTEQNTVAHGFYKLTYQFDFEGGDAYLPIAASRGESMYEGDLVYELVTGEDGGVVSVEGTAIGLVLSDATVVDGRYFIPENTTEEFSLYVIVTIPVSESDKTHALKVTSLPYTIVDSDSVSFDAGLSEAELAAYTTPPVTFFERNDSAVGNPMTLTTEVPERTEIDKLIYPDVKSDNFSFAPRR